MNPNASQLKVLFISSPKKDKCFILEALQNTNYEIFVAKSSNSGIQKTMEYLPDLIICQNELEDYNGFQIYNLLKDTLIKEGILFFIYSDYFDKEDILIGLEMGVDNFIVSPVDEKTLVEKIERQVRKVKDMRMAELVTFKTYLENTPVAKFVVTNNRIGQANEAFYNLLQIPEEKRNNPLFTEIFNFAENNQNAVNFKKCMHGFIQHCRLNKVSSSLNESWCYDIFLHYCDQNGKGRLFGEVAHSVHYTFPSSRNGNRIAIFRNTNQNKYSQNLELTRREKQVLEFSAQGLPIKQIAEQLELSRRTVEKHRANIMRKTGANNIVEAIYAASAMQN